MDGGKFSPFYHVLETLQEGYLTVLCSYEASLHGTVQLQLSHELFTVTHNLKLSCLVHDLTPETKVFL